VTLITTAVTLLFLIVKPVREDRRLEGEPRQNGACAAVWLHRGGFAGTDGSVPEDSQSLCPASVSTEVRVATPRCAMAAKGAAGARSARCEGREGSHELDIGRRLLHLVRRTPQAMQYATSQVVIDLGGTPDGKGKEALCDSAAGAAEASSPLGPRHAADEEPRESFSTPMPVEAAELPSEPSLRSSVGAPVGQACHSLRLSLLSRNSVGERVSERDRGHSTTSGAEMVEHGVTSYASNYDEPSPVVIEDTPRSRGSHSTTQYAQSQHI